MSTFNDNTTNPDGMALELAINQETILAFLEEMAADPDYDPTGDREEELLSAFIPQARLFHDFLLNEGVTTDTIALAMMLVGFRLGFFTGHLDGHACADAEREEHLPPPSSGGYI